MVRAAQPARRLVRRAWPPARRHGTAPARRPGARQSSSPFGTRRYYGRSSGSALHNGIDFEGKTGMPIYAAADGTINHQGFYFNYGRTGEDQPRRQFRDALRPHVALRLTAWARQRVRKGDLIGYIGSTGRSACAHLHFSVIVNGQFVDPARLYLREGLQRAVLVSEDLVSYRQWQQDQSRIRPPPAPATTTAIRGLQGAEPVGPIPSPRGSVDRLSSGRPQSAYGRARAVARAG